MRQALALTITLAVAMASLLSAAPPERPALPPIGEPNYAAYPKGGYKVEGGVVAERCTLPASSAAKIGQPTKAPDMGNELCKHHVWQLLMHEEAWNAGRHVARADWEGEGLTGDQQLQKLGELKSYFSALDGAYKGVLDSARAVLAAYAEQGGEPKIWDKATGKSGPALAGYYRALYALEMFINDGARNSPATIPQPQPDVLERVDTTILRMLKATDEVLADQLTAIHAEMETARSGVAGAAAPSAEVDRAGNRVAQRVGDWNVALKSPEMDAALGRAFDAAVARGQLTQGEAQGGRSVLAGKPIVVRSDDGRSYVAQPLVLPAARRGQAPVQTFKYAEIKRESTLESVSQDLVDNIRADRNFKARLGGLRQAAGEVATNPVRTGGEAARNLAQEQGLFAFMSGQTRPDMERKIEADRSRDAAKANDDFTAAEANLQREYQAAWDECIRSWSETEADESQITKSLQGSERAAALRRLGERRAKLTVAGPSETGVAERKKVSCTKDRQAITDAYLDTRDQSRALLEAKTQELSALETLEKGKLDEKEKVLRQLRRHYFRDELVKSKPRLEAKLAATLEPETKQAIVSSFLVASFPDSTKTKFYLPADWRPAAAPAPADYGKWAATESNDPIKTAKEDTFIGLFPLWKQSFFYGESPAKDEVVRKQAQDWIAAEFEKWLDAKERDTGGPKAPTLSKVERKPPNTRVGK